MYYVYILRSQKNPRELYTGYTTITPNKRLEYHNQGLVTHTNKFKPWQIIWFCAFRDDQMAKKFELYLKTASGIAFRNKRFIK